MGYWVFSSEVVQKGVYLEVNLLGYLGVAFKRFQGVVVDGILDVVGCEVDFAIDVGAVQCWWVLGEFYKCPCVWELAVP